MPVSCRRYRADLIPACLIVVTLLGAPDVVGTWFAFLAIHLAFQHANSTTRLAHCVDCSAWQKPTAGITSASTKTHKSTSENFGSLRPALWEPHTAAPDPQFPRSFLGQLLWPFQKG